MKTRMILFTALALTAGLIWSSAAVAQENDKIGERLLRAAEGLQYPGSESDSAWSFVSYPGEEDLPDADRFGEISGCSVGVESGTSRLDFDATLDRLGTVEPWMDRGQKESARGFRKLQGTFHREFGDNLAVYRCETGGPEVRLYFVGLDENGLAGLLTVSIET